MLPFVTVFGIKLPMYGLMMLTGLTIAVAGACLRSRRRGYMTVDIMLCAIFCFLGGLLGAKLLYIITDIPNMLAYFAQSGFSFKYLMHRIAHSGIVFYGGVIGGLIGGLIYVRLFNLSYWRIGDELIVWLPLGHGFGRIGCFCAGCCYGRAMDPPWGVYFTSELVDTGGVARFPVQLLEAAFDIALLFPILLLFARKPKKSGQVMGLYLVLYGIFRFFNEYVRADEIRGIFLGISTSQWISMALVPIGIALLCGLGARLEARPGTFIGPDGFIYRDEPSDDDEPVTEQTGTENEA